jgi:WD40 repeat protein
VDGCSVRYTSASFSADGRWLVSNWTDPFSPPQSVQAIRLWPTPGTGGTPPPRLDLPENLFWGYPALDPKSRFFVAVGSPQGGVEGAFVVPLDGSPHRALPKLPPETMAALQPAVSPSGRLAATASFYGQGRKILRIWDLEAGRARDFDLPIPPAGSVPGAPVKSAPSGYEGSINSLGFADETTLLTAGDGGIRRWNLENGAQEVLVASESGQAISMALSADGRTALTFEQATGPGGPGGCGRGFSVVDLQARQRRPLPEFGDCLTAVALDPSPRRADGKAALPDEPAGRGGRGHSHRLPARGRPVPRLEGRADVVRRSEEP